MTAVAEHQPRRIELGHPVRSFVLLLVGIALALVVLQWTGFANPRLQLTDNSGTYSNGPVQTYTVAVRNDAPLPVEIVELDWPTEMANAEVGIAPSSTSPDGSTVSYLLEPFAPFTLDAGETAWLGIRGVPGCSATVGSPSVVVRTPSGLRHEVELGRGSFVAQAGCE